MSAGRGRASYLLRRLLQAVPVLLTIVVLNFLMLHRAPGDAADVLAGEAGSASPEYMAQLRARFGLDRALGAQLVLYVTNVLTLNLGFSFRHSMPVLDLIMLRLGLTLSLFYMALYTRIMRAAILEQAGMDYVATARAKGLSERRIVLAHVLRNPILPVVTMAGVQVGSLLGGSIVVESVFAWPGLGLLAFQSLFARDLNLLMGIFLLSTCLVIAVNLAVDFAYTLLDPRIHLG